MRPVTYEEFNNVAKDDPYYNGRWGYYEKAIEILKYIKFDSALELGPNKLPLIVGSETIDISSGVNPTYLHDAHVIPWPVKKYDIFIGLQVLEHLKVKQAVFLEIMRISDSAIISLPYNWKDSYPSHNGIDLDIINHWTLGIAPKSYIITGIAMQRIVLYYEFDDEMLEKARKRSGLFE